MSINPVVSNEEELHVIFRADIEAAAARIDGHIHTTPVMRTRALFDGRDIEIKLENTQMTGSFKVRGAFNTLLSCDVPDAGVVAASGGNHGAAVAYAARALGHPATIFVPELAGASKIALIRSTGADLHVVAGQYADALAAAQAFEADTGAMQIHAYDAPATVAGQGTLMREWQEQGFEADTVLIAVGGGGLLAGQLAWLRDQPRPQTRVVAVEPENCPTLWVTTDGGGPQDVEVSGIAANALGARRLGQICHDLVVETGPIAITVSDEAILEAQRQLWEALRQWVEPAGATALAALISGEYEPAPDERLAVLICGANPAPGPFD